MDVKQKKGFMNTNHNSQLIGIKYPIKCIVWDLDNTLWNGVLLEDNTVSLKTGVLKIIQKLDLRGILHSIASKNDHRSVMLKLADLKIDSFFLYPEITWNAKSHSLHCIQNHLNISMKSILFIDDQVYEIEEVRSVHPDINYLHASHYSILLDHPQLKPRFITKDSPRRREFYKIDQLRKESEKKYVGSTESFLASLKMKMSIDEAVDSDLKRAEELAIRTHQLNATGRTFSYAELDKFRRSNHHKLLICDAQDKFGDYGKIGLTLLEIDSDQWNIRLLLMSCRVISRGMGSILLNYLVQQAFMQKKKLLADFKDTGYNKMMFLAYRFSGFKIYDCNDEGEYIFHHDYKKINKLPDYVKINASQW